jgi:metalloendopeptidase OMA1, mitochondrial
LKLTRLMDYAMLVRSTLPAMCLALLAAAWCGCSVNPYTQRRQLVMVSPSYEAKLGAVAYRRMLDDPENEVRSDPATVLPVRRVSARLIAAARESKYADIARSFEWDVSVIDDPTMRNAVALPGGKLLVYTGLFPVAQHEAGLAVVLGHEIVHALARHSAEQLTYDALRVLREEATRLPFSRSHESEADYIGLLLTAAAGYDPREAVGLWERMKASGDELPPEYLSTHPSYDSRIEHLQAHMQEAWEVYEHTRRF